MRKQLLIPYMIASVLMAAALLYMSKPGVSVARSYHSYNNVTLTNNPEYKFQSVYIPMNNTIVPVTAEEARNLMDGVLVFAYPTCPYCRNLMPELVKAANETNTTIYYCKLDEYRDKFVWNEETGKQKLVVQAGKGYYGLLGWLDDYLSEYIIKDSDGNEVDIGEKRIMAPTIVTVKNGQPVSTWKLDNVAGVTYPDNAYERWNKEMQTKVSDALHGYLAG